SGSTRAAGSPEQGARSIRRGPVRPPTSSEAGSRRALPCRCPQPALECCGAGLTRGGRAGATGTGLVVGSHARGGTGQALDSAAGDVGLRAVVGGAGAAQAVGVPDHGGYSAPGDAGAAAGVRRAAAAADG